MTRQSGGIQAAKLIKERLGEDFYRKIGKLGGTKSKGGGFTNNPELARIAGARGGSISRRGRRKDEKQDAE